MKFDILNRHSGEIEFTDEIEADDETTKAIKVGLAIKLRRANLRRARLIDADLNGARLIVIYGLFYLVTINNDDIAIGCETHKTTEWDNFTDEQIHKMDGNKATEFWKINKQIIIGLANSFEKSE